MQINLFGQLKTCKKCKQEKSLLDYYKNKLTKDRHLPICKKCANIESTLYRKNNLEADRKIANKSYYKHNEARKIGARTYYRKNLEKVKAYKLKKYGLTIDEFELILIKQNNECCVCNIPFKKTSDAKIDHCHKSGKTRGIICNHCNIALGHTKDNIEILYKLIEYLKENG